MRNFGSTQKSPEYPEEISDTWNLVQGPCTELWLAVCRSSMTCATQNAWAQETDKVVAERAQVSGFYLYAVRLKTYCTLKAVSKKYYCHYLLICPWLKDRPMNSKWHLAVQEG